VKSIAS